MYCSDCGTVNPAHAEHCLKCGRELGKPKPVEKSEVDIALAARPVSGTHTGPSGRFTSRLLIMLLAGAVLLLGPMVFMNMQVSEILPDYAARDAAKPPYDPAAGEAGAADFDSGLGLAPTLSPQIIAQDVAKKSNAAKARVALAQHFAERGFFPDTLDDLGSGYLGFVPDPDVYTYQVLNEGLDFRFEVILASDVVSGADVVKDGDVTKLIFTGDSLY